MAVYQWRAGDQKGYLNTSLQLDTGCGYTAAGPRPQADIHTVECHQTNGAALQKSVDIYI